MSAGSPLGDPQGPVGRSGPLVGVLLAAGGGSRMGGPKALQPLAGRPMVVRAATVLMHGGCDRLVVVVGASGEAVTDLLLAERDFIGTHPKVVINPGWEDGLASSVRAGLLAAEGLGAGGALLHLVDLPDVSAGVIARLRDCWLRTPTDDHAWVAAYAGESRNPVLLAGGVIPDVLGSLQGDRGARVWLDRHPSQVTAVECGDIGDGADLDTPADLAAWQATQQSQRQQLGAPPTWN